MQLLLSEPGPGPTNAIVAIVAATKEIIIDNKAIHCNINPTATILIGNLSDKTYVKYVRQISNPIIANMNPNQRNVWHNLKRILIR